MDLDHHLVVVPRDGRVLAATLIASLPHDSPISPLSNDDRRVRRTPGRATAATDGTNHAHTGCVTHSRSVADH